MGGDYSNTNESMADILKAMQSYFPGTLEAIRGTYGPQAKAEFDVTKEYTPKYAELTYDTLSGPGRKLSELGRELSKEEQLGAGQTEAEIARTVGPKLAQAVVDLQSIVDPEFMGGRQTLGKAIDKSLTAVDPNKLTAQEMESIASGLARTGNYVPSAMETARNAMTFGDALAKRRAEYNQAITTAAGALPSTRLGVTGFEAGTKRTLTPNFGQQQYTGVQTPGVNTSNQIGSQYLNNATQIQNTVMQKQKDWMDKMQSITQSIGNIGSMVGGMAI